MNRKGIKVSQDTVELHLAGGEALKQPMSAIRRLLVIRHENDLFHGDESFYVVEFDGTVWVLPHFTPDLQTFLGRVSQVPVFCAEVPAIPFSWRKKVLGFLPLFPVPRLAEHPKTTLPDWELRGPYRLTDIEGPLPIGGV